MKNYLAVDSGGSKVLAILYDEDFRPVKTCRVGSMRGNTTSKELIRRNVDTLIESLGLAGMCLDCVSGIVDGGLMERMKACGTVVMKGAGCGELEAGLAAAGIFEAYLDSFLALYRNHQNLLRFNQFFNIYLVSEAISEEEMEPYLDMVKGLERRFGKIYQKARQDGTLRTDIPQKKMFSATLHLMLAVVTRYAVGLVYNDETDAEEELLLQKEMLMRRFVNAQ